MPYEILYNSWLICCTIIGRLFCKRKDDHDLAGPSKNDTRAGTGKCLSRQSGGSANLI